jgi:hypothetical protein
MTAGTWRVLVDVSALMDDHEQRGSLSQLLQQGLRGVLDTAATRDPSARLMALIVTASFRFEPCPKEDQAAGCGDRAVAVTWQ